jgi:hypothetical protein
MSALVGVHAEAWGMPNHCQHVLVDGDLPAAYVLPVEEGAGRVSGSSRCSPGEGRPEATTQSPRRSLAQRMKIASASASLGDRSGGSPR